jgi:hypothetical protein
LAASDKAATVTVRSPSALDKPFSGVGKAIGLRRQITPRAMRRTFQDLTRNADIEAIVRQGICGQATDEMSDLYSTVSQREIQAAVGAVISLAKYRELLQAGPQDSASWWERPKLLTATPRSRGTWPCSLSGRRGSNPRRPPWQRDRGRNRP